MGDENIQLSLSTLKMVSKTIEQRGEDEVRRALQAVIEGTAFGESSLDDKLVYEFEQVRFSERQMRDDRLYVRRFDGLPQTLRRHRNGGGFVPLEQSESDITKPFVADSAYVGPYACVRDNARVIDKARVMQNARVIDSAGMSGRAQAWGASVVSGAAQLRRNAMISGQMIISRGVYTERIIPQWP